MTKPEKKSKETYKPKAPPKKRAGAIKKDESVKNEPVADLGKITRKSLEEKVNEQTHELENKGEQIRESADREKLAQEQIFIRNKAMDSASDGIFIIDAQNVNFPIIYANSSFKNLIGQTGSSIIGQDYFHLYGAAADLRLIDEIKRSLREGKAFHGEMMNFRKQGQNIWSFLRISLLRDNKGIITHYVGIQTDITQIKKNNLEIEEQREELLHVTRVGKLAEFVSSLAHEISQPLTAILAYAQAAQRLYAGKEPEMQEILQYIVDDDQRATEVIRRLRLLLKKTKPVFEPLNINALINDTAKLIQTHVAVRNQRINFELADDLPLFKGDRIQIQQVLLNLISNSLESMETENDSLELSIRTFLTDAETILVEVKDSGTGITSENMNRVFTHFFTSKLNGLGMGLPISRSIVEAHGGWLNAKNNAGGGATFYFTLPVILKERIE